MEWIKIDKDMVGEIPDNICCWVFDERTECIVFFEDDDFIESGRFTHYIEVKKPLPPD